MFDNRGVRRNQDLGYRQLSRRCWDARLHDDLPALLELAADPSLTPDMLSSIAPGAQDPNADVDLVTLILAHPACTGGVASRFATHTDPGVRLKVASFPGLVTSTLAVLAIDEDDRVRQAAHRALDERIAGMTGR